MRPTLREQREQKLSKIRDLIYGQVGRFTITDIVNQLGNGNARWRRAVIDMVEDMINKGMLNEVEQKGRGTYYEWTIDV